MAVLGQKTISNGITTRDLRRLSRLGENAIQHLQFNNWLALKFKTPEMRAEISYDLVMDEDMAFVEGTYRLPGGDWQVVIVSAFERDVSEAQVVHQRWDSGVSGVFIRLPRTEQINAAAVERVLSDALGVSEWVRVRGPDSMRLR